MLPVEFLFFALYFMFIANLAQKQATDTGQLPKLLTHTRIQFALWLLLTALLFLLSDQMYNMINGAIYLISLVIAFVLSIQMRETIEAA